MDIIVEFNKSAFNHGISKDAIRQAIVNAVYDDIWDETADKHLLMGFDYNGNLLEIMYNVIDDASINVFHALKCRNIYSRLLEKRK